MAIINEILTENREKIGLNDLSSFYIKAKPHLVFTVFDLWKTTEEIYNTSISEIKRVFRIRRDIVDWLVSRLKGFISFYEMDSSSDSTMMRYKESERAVSIMMSGQMVDVLSHFLSMPLFNNFRFDPKVGLEATFNKMAEIEAEWQKKNDGKSIFLTGDETMIAKYPDGYAWFDLNRSSCEDEANAMGHCGNSGGSSDETILSLRKKDGYGGWTPFLTFTLDLYDGRLVERKGRANSKPAERYHKYIVDLLIKDRRIKGFDDEEGYLKENDFKITDLSEGDIKNLTKSRPDLAGAYGAYITYGPDSKEVDSALEKNFIRSDSGIHVIKKAWDDEYEFLDIINENRSFSGSLSMDNRYFFESLSMARDYRLFDTDRVDTDWFISDVLTREDLGKFRLIDSSGIIDEESVEKFVKKNIRIMVASFMYALNEHAYKQLFSKFKKWLEGGGFSIFFDEKGMRISCSTKTAAELDFKSYHSSYDSIELCIVNRCGALPDARVSENADEETVRYHFLEMYEFD